MGFDRRAFIAERGARVRQRAVRRTTTRSCLFRLQRWLKPCSMAWICRSRCVPHPCCCRIGVRECGYRCLCRSSPLREGSRKVCLVVRVGVALAWNFDPRVAMGKRRAMYLARRNFEGRMCIVACALGCWAEVFSGGRASVVFFSGARGRPRPPERTRR